MGKVCSSFSMTVRRIRVLPEKVIMTEQIDSCHDIERTENNTLNVSEIFNGKTYFASEQDPLFTNDGKTDSGDRCRTQHRTKLVDIGDQGAEYRNDSASTFHFSVEDTRAGWSDSTESISSASVLKSLTKDENAIPTLKELPCTTTSREEICNERFSSPKNDKVSPVENIYSQKCSLGKSGFNDQNDSSHNCHSLQQNDGQEEWKYCHFKQESLTDISCAGCSTEGTVGSGTKTFLDLEDRNDSSNYTFSERHLENVEVDKNPEDNENELETEYVTRPTLTSLSLQTLNCDELDKTECVRNFIQALESPELTIDVEALSPTRLDCQEFSGPDEETFDQNSLELYQSPRREDEDDEENLLFKPATEKFFKSPSYYWNNYRYDRAPWNHVASTNTAGTAGESTFSGNDDDDERSWPRSVSWNDSRNRLTLCSLSTINEESDDDKEPIGVAIDSKIIVNENY